MELVKGIPITRFCDERQLDANERLLLFADVCAAINHAHQKGVIHRDVKPSNVLVTLDGDKPLVKVIDFGISKAIEGKLTDGTLFTRLEQWVGTPVYMSPEQAGLGSLDIDTRSDIYALGVLLYELLTGVPPFDQATLIQAGFEEMRRIIREVEPVRPSLRLTSLHAGQAAPIAAARRVSEGRLHRIIAYDLDWIVMKAIDKSRDRRYETAAALADDIARFLADQPVTAKPPGTFYLFRKFAKRHRVGFRVACGFAILVVATAVFSSWLALRATKAEALAGQRLTEAVAATNSLTKAEALAQLRLADAIAERNAKEGALQDAQAVSGLLAEVFKRPDPAMDGRKVTVVAALDAATGKLNSELGGQPERLAMLLEVLAGTYERLTLDDKSLALRERVFEIRRSYPGIENPESLEALRRLIENYERLGQFDRSRDLAAQEIPLSRRLRGDKHEQTLLALRSLANGYYQTGDRAKAIVAQQVLLESTRLANGDQSYPFIVAQWQLNQYQQRGAGGSNVEPQGAKVKGGIAQSPENVEPPPEPDDKLRQAMEEFTANRTTYGAAHIKTLKAQARLAEFHFTLKQTDEAVRNQTEIYALAQKAFGPLDETTLQFQKRLATMCYHSGLQSEAVRIQQNLLALLRERDGDNAPSLLETEDTLLYFHSRGGGYTDYINLLKQVFERRSKYLGLESPFTLSIESELALRLMGDDQALGHAEHALPLLRKLYGNNDRRTADAMSNLARCYLNVNKGREALQLLKECGVMMRDDTFVNLLLAQMQLCFGLKEDYNATRRWMIDYAASKRDHFASRHDILERVVFIACLAPLENESQAIEVNKTLDRAQAIRLAPEAPIDYGHGKNGRNIITGVALFRTGQPAKAIEYFDLVLGTKDDDESWRGWDRSMVGFYKAMALYQLGRVSEGRTLLDVTAKTMVPWPSDKTPIDRNWVPSGALMTHGLVYKEAKQLFEPAKPITHVLTDAASGRKLDVTLLALADGTLTVRRASDGKEFTLALASLTKEDQAFIAGITIP